jgi:DNA-binding response OmpR family regulator
MSEKNCRILLVDDEQHLLISLKDYLVSERFDVVTATSGEEALAMLDQVKPGLIVLDISMPGMGGLGFLRNISGPDGKTAYPVLVLTARSMLESFFDSVAVAGFLTKPCDENKLVSTIRKILASTQKRPARSQGRQFTVLLAENDPRVMAGMTTAFTTAGFEVLVAVDGPDVLDKAVTLNPDVVVMKEILPRLNGSAVARLIDVMTSLSGLPVLIYDERLNGKEEDEAKPRVARCVKRYLAVDQPAAVLAATKALLY